MKTQRAMRRLSKISSLPLLRNVSPADLAIPDADRLEGFLQSQRLAYRAVREVSKLITEGWTEIQAAKMVETYLLDSGVSAFFHRSFAWFGERTRFDGISHYKDFQPSHRVIRPGEVFILDVAPISRGFVSDVGFTSSLGENQKLLAAKQLLIKLRELIPQLFDQKFTGSQVWREVEKQMLDAGYSNAYKIYPFSVLGHRVHESSTRCPQVGLLHFGWQSFWSIASRGIFGQLLGPHFEGNPEGLWAIEPHLGGAGFGAKFEEILMVSKDGARWLEEIPEKAWM